MTEKLGAFVEFTGLNGEPVFVNAGANEMVEVRHSAELGTRVLIAGEFVQVKESYEAALRKLGTVVLETLQ